MLPTKPKCSEDKLENYHSVTYILTEQNGKTLLTLKQDNNPSQEAADKMAEKNWARVLGIPMGRSDAMGLKLLHAEWVVSPTVQVVNSTCRPSWVLCVRWSSSSGRSADGPRQAFGRLCG